MIPEIGDAAAFARSVDRLDYVRFAPLSRSSRLTRVEWFHFVVHLDDLDLLVNFSLVDGAPGTTGAPAGRIVLLARRSGGGWEGDVDTVEPGAVRFGTGRIRLEMGGASLAFDGKFHLSAETRRRPLSVELVLEPRCFACLAHNLSNDPRGTLHWLVVPRLRASGVVRLDGATIPIHDAPAYHDHNWGTIDGRQLAWEWACSLSRESWSVVMVRMLDRTRSEISAQGLLLWDGAHRKRGFRGNAVSFSPEGLLRPGSLLSVPRALALLPRGASSDVPLRVQVAGASDGDWVRGELRCLDAARVIVPQEASLETSVIHEVAARLSLNGQIAGAPLALDAPAFAEFAGPMP